MEILGELSEDLRGVSAKLSPTVVAQLEESVSMLSDNLGKVAEHGQRANRIVHGMLMHAQATSDEREPADLNEILRESARLAHNGLRVRYPDFQVEMIERFDASLGPVDVVPSDMGRVFLNIIHNACYAVRQKQRDAGRDWKGRSCSRPGPPGSAWRSGSGTTGRASRRRSPTRSSTLLHHQADGGGHRPRALAEPRHRDAEAPRRAARGERRRAVCRARRHHPAARPRRRAAEQLRLTSRPAEPRESPWQLACRRAAAAHGADPTMLRRLAAFAPGPGERAFVEDPLAAWAHAPGADFEAMESAAREGRSGLSGAIVERLSPPLPPARAADLARRFEALDRGLGGLPAFEARLLRLGLSARLSEVLARPERRPSRVRDVIDFYYSHASCLCFGGPHRPTPGALASAAELRPVAPGLDYALVEALSTLGPLRLHLLRARSPRLSRATWGPPRSRSIGSSRRPEPVPGSRADT